MIITEVVKPVIWKGAPFFEVTFSPPGSLDLWLSTLPNSTCNPVTFVQQGKLNNQLNSRGTTGQRKSYKWARRHATPILRLTKSSNQGTPVLKPFISVNSAINETRHLFVYYVPNYLYQKKQLTLVKLLPSRTGDPNCSGFVIKFDLLLGFAKWNRKHGKVRLN